jgi:hypothetical protein
VAGKAGDLALIFGGGSDAASAEGPSGDTDITELGGDESPGEDEEADAPPADFAVHAAEAFPELAGDDARVDALYRAIKACHPGV